MLFSLLNLRLHATVNFERCNSRTPVKCAVSFQVLGGIPEGAIINRIHAHVAVVAPTVQGTGLRTRTLDHGRLVAQRVQWISGQSC